MLHLFYNLRLSRVCAIGVYITLTADLASCRPAIDDNVPDPSASSKAVIDPKSITPEMLSQAYLPLAGGTMTGGINMGGNSLTGLGTPTNSSDAATKSYVDTRTASAAAADDTTGYVQATNSGSNWSSTTTSPSQRLAGLNNEILRPAGEITAFGGTSAPTGFLT